MNIVVLISGEGTNLQAIIDSIANKALTVSIRCVISNTADARGLMRARKANIATQLLDKNAFATRSEFEQALNQEIQRYSPDIIVLAGFMQVLSASFVNDYFGKIINVHPSLLPKYRGLRTHERVLENQDDKHGTSIHYVTPELDGGPVIIQGQIAVHSNDTVTSLKTRIQKVEHLILIQALQLIATQKLSLNQESEILVENSPKFTAFVKKFPAI